MEDFKFEKENFLEKFEKPNQNNYDMDDENIFCHNQGRMQAKQQCWKNLYMEKYQFNPERLSDKYVDELCDVADKKENYEQKNCWFIVINPKDDIDMGEFVNACIRASRKSWIVRSKLWFEFRDHKNGKGIHANFALGSSKYAESRVKGEFFNTFKSFIGSEKSRRNNYINVQRALDSEERNFMEYQFSKGKFEMDVFWLEKYGIDQDYMWNQKSFGKSKKSLLGW